MAANFTSVMTGTPEQRVEALRQFLGYPLKQRDPGGSRFWYLRPGEDEAEAQDTLPIAVGFYAELNGIAQREVPRFLMADDQRQEIDGHYMSRVSPYKPVMYLLLPEGEQQGTVAMILPTEGRLRQRQIQVFAWNAEDLQARLTRLRQDTLKRTNRMQEKVWVVPLVEWAFYKPIATAKELAQELARVSHKMEQAIPAVYVAEGADGYLHNLLKSFQRELLPTLKLQAETAKDYSFADIYAQTIAYGLFTARVFSYTVDERERQKANDPSHKERDFNRQNAWELLPETNPFLRRLFRDVSERPIAELGDDLGDAISEVFSILRAAKMEAILEDFRQKMNREDIVIRFYEDFLAAYKPEMRERRGVYYTPEPVVSYMVRSVDILLKEKFDKPLGLADPEVRILDPACGTGTFLLWIFQLIHQRFEENPEAIQQRLEEFKGHSFQNLTWSEYVKEGMLDRIFGFELLMAPYAICHLKLGLFLEETGYKFENSRRLEIYLADTLDEAARKSESLIEGFIAEESDLATAIKREKTVMVVVGNPPYSVSSSNKGKFIEKQMQRYKEAVKSEKNIQPLSDDYIKFLCFAHHQIEKTGYGIISYITNHSYINGLVHRGLREELQKTFESIYVLDLHGNSLIKEHIPIDIQRDDNVFDIQQGVSIFKGIKHKKEKGKEKIFESRILKADLWGSRDDKYFWMTHNAIDDLEWLDCDASSPNFFFDSSASPFESEFSKCPCLIDIFIDYSTGIETGKDESLVGFSREDLENVIKDLYDENFSDMEVYEKYGIQETSGWKISKKRKKLFKSKINRSLFSSYCYRPFDERVIYYNDFLRRPHKELMRHCSKRNLLLMASRQQAKIGFNHAFVTQIKSDCNALSLASRERNYYFPLYLCDEEEDIEEGINQETLFHSSEKNNLSKEFVDLISSGLGCVLSPERIFYYMYAILHSPTYRLRYSSLLKIGFPRIPVTRHKQLFDQLSKYGEQLVRLHLLSWTQNSYAIGHVFNEDGGRTVDPGHPKYANGKVTINRQGTGFTGVPEEVWNFYIGGYQVCHKWLKDRKGRTLSDDDILHYQKIIVALQETIRIMQQIDEAIPSWPIE